MNNERDYGVVGDIRIKQPRKKKPKKNRKEKSESNTSLWIKILVWFMFIAMFGSFVIPLIYYFISVMSSS